MIHGGDLLTYEKHYDGELVDYSSNINPLGLPEGLEKEIMHGLINLEAYPDIQYRKLKESVANYLNCKVENTVLGNGAVELIDNFIFLANRVLISTPAFSEYEERALVHKKELVRILYKDDFTIDKKSIENTIREGDMLVLGNPNNPTGLRIDEEDLIELYSITRKSKAFLLLDEAFFEFCPKDYDSIDLFKKYDYENLGIIRAATKFFALPGIRLGYGCTSEEMEKEITRVQLPWSVNALAEIAGRHILNDKDYIEESKKYIEKERNYLLKELSTIKGMKVFNTHTNYILIKLYKWDEEYVFNYFLKRGIVIRKCSSFIGLDKDYIRVAIKDRENNIRLLEVFKDLGESL